MIETSAENATLKKFNQANLPPEGSQWVGKYFNQLWETARKEKIGRLQLHQRFLDLHAQYRGKKRKMTYPRIGANYIFKTIETYCATLTEKVPISEMVAENTDRPELIQAFDLDNKRWWESTNQQFLLECSTKNMQIYGTTIEKVIWDIEGDQAGIYLVDIFNCFPAPGFKMCSMDLPYFCEVDFLEPWEIRSKFGIDENINIPTDADEQLAGTIRETVRGGREESPTGRHYPTNYANIPSTQVDESLKNKTMVIEIWVKDKSVAQDPIIEQVPITDDLGRPIANQDGSPMMENIDTGQVKQYQKYPDGIRKVVICPALMNTEGIKGVLDDSINPMINWTLLDQRIQELVETGIPEPVVDDLGNPMVDQMGQPLMQAVPVDEDQARMMIYERAKLSFPLWGKFPYHATPSRVDTAQWFGFSIIEQLEELQGKFEMMLTKYIMAYERMMFPALINPQGSGVEEGECTNEPGLIWRPTLQVAQAHAIYYAEPPQPPSEYLDCMQFLMESLDIVSMTPAVTEGRRPTGISAASAIIALQDKAATLTSPQIRQIDDLIEWRGKAQIHMNMNFDTSKRQVLVDGQPVMFRGIDIFTNFKFNVESGSSAPITKAGRRQLYLELFKMGAIDLQSLLEYLDIPQAKKIVERVTEQNSVPGALKILQQAGVPPEVLAYIYQIAMQPQMETKPTGGTEMKTAEGKAGGYTEGINNSRQGMSELREG